MTGPRRVLIDWDYRAHGIWRVLSKEEMEAPAPRGGRWADGAPFPPVSRPRPWGDRLFRVHPPGSWPARTWRQELLGYAPRDGQDAEGAGSGPAGGP